MEQSNIYICSASPIKTDPVKELFGNDHKIIPISHKFMTPDQPIDEGTSISCFIRILEIKKNLEENKSLKKGDRIFAFENGIYKIYSEYFDICIFMVYDYDTDTINRYNSFGIRIDKSLIDMYNGSLKLDSESPDSDIYSISEYSVKFLMDETNITPDDELVNTKHIFQQYATNFKRVVFAKKENFTCLGYANTFGSFLNKCFDVKSDNWSLDPKFGSIDRKEQIYDCMYKYFINVSTDVIPDYPKPGVLFKHITSVLVNPKLLNIMYKVLERVIKDNYNLKDIDFFAGLDARGFYFAPVLARVFNKGFIPIRKASKVPKTDTYKIATESYGTEYSKDEFGLEFRDAYAKKNVLILDDLLATGGSLVGASNVLRKVGANVVGAVTIYDVPSLRYHAGKKLFEANIKYNVMINENNVPLDFGKLVYQIPEFKLRQTRAKLLDKNENIRKFTMSNHEWLGIDTKTTDSHIDDTTKMKNVSFIYTDKDKSLATKIIENIVCELGADMSHLKSNIPITTGIFSNGEIRCEIDANIRNRHVVIVSQIRTGHINDDFMQLNLILDTCRRSGADKITVIMPYYPYSRSDKKDAPRCAIGAKVVARMLEFTHIDNLISLDLHAGQLQGHIDSGFHNLYMIRYICDYIYNNYLKYYNDAEWNNHFILIAPDAGASKAVKKYSKLLGINNIIMDKERDYSNPGTVLRSRYTGSIDDFKGKTGIIIDDMIDTMGTMCSAVNTLVNDGLLDVIVIATHGVLSGPAITNINNSEHIKEVIVSDSLPQSDNIAKSPKINILSSAEILARTLDGIVTGRSISRLFDKKEKD